MIIFVIIALWFGVLINFLKLFLVAKKPYILPEGAVAPEEDGEAKQKAYTAGRRAFASIAITFWGVIMAFSAILLTEAHF